jgi:hypothetical protein
MPPRCIRLTERVPRIVRLRLADIDFLLASRRGRFEVSPTGAANRYRLIALGVAGFLQMPHTRRPSELRAPCRSISERIAGVRSM